MAQQETLGRCLNNVQSEIPMTWRAKQRASGTKQIGTIKAKLQQVQEFRQPFQQAATHLTKHLWQVTLQHLQLNNTSRARTSIRRLSRATTKYKPIVLMLWCPAQLCSPTSPRRNRWARRWSLAIMVDKRARRDKEMAKGLGRWGNHHVSLSKVIWEGMHPVKTRANSARSLLRRLYSTFTIRRWKYCTIIWTIPNS